MKMTDDRREYLKQYRKEKLKRVPLDLTIEEYEKLKAAAARANKSVNGFIKWRLQVYYGMEGRK